MTTFLSSTAQPITVAITDDGQEKFRTMRDIERDVYAQALAKYKSPSQVARVLRVGRSTVYRKIREHGFALGSQTPADAV